jgi:hypothetical protein
MLRFWYCRLVESDHSHRNATDAPEVRQNPVLHEESPFLAYGVHDCPASEAAKWRNAHAGEQSRIFAARGSAASVAFSVSRQYHWFSAIDFLQTKQAWEDRGLVPATTVGSDFVSMFNCPSVAGTSAGS